MGKYSIKDLEHLSGIKAHTIRIWEKRYGIVRPQRTSTNIRYYSDEDLKKIINVSLLNNSGIKISHIADMSTTEISSRILKISESRDSRGHIENLIVSMIELDESRFTGILSNMINDFGMEQTMVEIVYPFLEKIGILWQTKNISPAQEHFISNIIRQKIISGIDQLPIPRGTRKILLFQPEGELHELGLLFYHFILRKSGNTTIYLGANVPYNDLLETVRIHNPDVLVTALVAPLTGDPEKFLTQLVSDFKGHVLASGSHVRQIEKNIPRLHIFHNPLVINQLISEL